MKKQYRGVVALGVSTVVAAALVAPGVQAAIVQPRTFAVTSNLAVIKTIAVVASPFAVAIHGADDSVYVTHYDDSGTVSVINGHTGTVDDTIPVGADPFAVAVNQADDTVYVANEADGTVSVIDGKTGTAVSAIVVGANPKGVAVNQIDDTVYVTSEADGTVSVINGRTGLRTDDTITVGVGPFALGVNDADDTVYVVNSYGDNVSVINGRTGLRTDDTITVGVYPFAVAVNQADDTVYVTNATDGTVSVINGRTNTLASTVGVGQQSSGVAVDQGDDTVYVTNPADGTVSVINGRTGLHTDDTITVGSGPIGVSVDGAGTNSGLVYVTDFISANVSVIGLVTPMLGSTYAAADDTLTLTLVVPQAAYDVDDSTITSVAFDDTLATNLTAGAGDTWTLTVPAGMGTVPVTVTFNGGLNASAGNFTYGTPPGPNPPAPAPPSPAAAPLDVTATAGDASATLTWKAPASSGDYPVTAYRAISSPGGRTCLVTAPALTCEVIGLRNGTDYTFSVQALTGAGWGSTSSPSDAVTPTAPARPSITITGTRDSNRIVVSGTATGLANKILRPWIRFPGQTSYTEGTAAIAPAVDGSFTWSRKTGKRTYVYVVHGETRSNTVTLPAR